MKILYIITQGENGGAQKYTLDLATHFKGSIAFGQEGDFLFRVAKSRNIPTHKLRFLKRNINPILDILALWEIWKLIKRDNPDIVHTNSSKAGILGSMAGKLAGKKVVFTAHGFQFLEPIPSWKKFGFLVAEKIASKFRDHIICVSYFDKSAALSFGICRPEKIVTVHNGLDAFPTLDKKLARKQLNLPLEQTILGTIANHYHTKGLDIFLNAIALLPKDLSYKVVIIGSGPETKTLQKLSVTLNLGTKVNFVPRINEAAKLLPAFDIFILPSRKEGFPYVLLEALFYGLPILATNVGGNSEIIGNAGLLTEPEAPRIAESLTSLIKDTDLQQRFRQSAKRQFLEFTTEKMFEQTLEVYKKALGHTQIF